MLPAPDRNIWPDDLQMAFTATPLVVREGLAQMLAMPPLCHLTDDGRSTAELVLAEVLNNVAEHAYAEGPGTVTVTLGPTARGLRCVIVDHGKAMPGGVLPEGRLTTSPDMALEDLPEGGFGWHLIRSLTTDLHYARVNGCNQLQFILP